MSIFRALFAIFKNRYPIQTFTYYIPSPPNRKTGYREKLFDKTFYNFINQGFDIISIKTVANSRHDQSGMWFICTVQATNKRAAKLDLITSFDESTDDATHLFTQNDSNEIIYENDLTTSEDEIFIEKES